jgi:hypothetical protein
LANQKGDDQAHDYCHLSKFVCGGVSWFIGLGFFQGAIILNQITTKAFNYAKAD